MTHADAPHLSEAAGGFSFVAPRVVPPLDPQFRPAALEWRAFQERARATKHAARARFALEQEDGSVYCFATDLPPEGDPAAAASFEELERLVKLALWTCGGHRIYLDAPGTLSQRLRAHYRDSPTGRFDSEIVGERVHAHALEIVATNDVPAEHSNAAALGGHREGCRIGFDLGGSDRKVAAVVDGEVVFSEETEWDPYHQRDPRYHWDGIMDSLRRAAQHLPRVDAIGGSAAGVYVKNEIKFSSLFRGIPRDLFEREVKHIFLDLQKEWGGVPFEVVNDGDVTALLGAMSIGDNAVLGLALGTSTAGGFVDANGRITSRLNEIAFAPIDYRHDAPRDEWSGDGGCCVQYLSQQAVGRLLAPAGIVLPEGMSLPQSLKEVQTLMAAGDPRARAVYRTIGVYLGYAIAHLASVYDFRNALLLGRVTSGAASDVMLEAAREVLEVDFPALAERIAFHVPSEKDKRHGQAIAASSLPAVR